MPYHTVISYTNVDQISEHEIKVYLFLKDHPWWVSIKEIHRELTDVARVTINAHLRRFVAESIVEKIHIFPGDRYKFLPENGETEYRTRLDGAAQVFQK